MKLRELCEKRPNDYILLFFWGNRETIAKGCDLLETVDQWTLDQEVIVDDESGDYYDIFAELK